ncbi:MAG: DUF192 domain-containing protein [Desulfobacterales bacterium]|nr:DUF192 domain-containing protein [Desulfobacterales bacterium]
MINEAHAFSSAGLCGLRSVTTPLALCLALAILCAFMPLDAAGAGPSSSVRPDGALDFINFDGQNVASIVIEIAETAAARTRGLMERETLHLTDGMLFVFPQEAMLTFWMHNTFISLDILFVDKDRRVINIAEATTPMNSTIQYHSQKPAQYVVEVPAGFVKLHHIQKGMQVRWRRR